MTIERSYPVLGVNRVDVLVGSARSRGAMSILTQTHPPGDGPPPHVHAREDEYLASVTGTFEVFDGTGWTTVPEQGVFMPRGRIHTFRNAGAAEGKVFIVTTPGGLDEFLERLGPYRLPQDVDRLVAISADYGITYPAPWHERASGCKTGSHPER